jgi:hypothetical protein
VESIRKRLTYANVMSSLAVFMVLGGGAAVAAINLPKNSVGSRELQPNAVKTGYLAKNAVRTGKVAFEAIKAGKLSKNAVPTNRLRDSAVKTGKIANDAVTGDKVNESTLGTVPSANIANEATVGSPRAYAQIDAGGGINEGEPSRGIVDANVTSPATGVYCVDLPFAPQTASGNAESGGGEDGIVSLQLGAPFPVCPNSAEAEVRIRDASTETEDGGEDIWVQFDS